MTHIDDLRAAARRANSRPISELDDGTIMERERMSFIAPVPRWFDQDRFTELELGEDAPDYDRRLAEGFALMGASDE